MAIPLGSRIRDRVTGLEGIATARVHYLNGCIQYCLAPQISGEDKTKVPAIHYIDIGQLEVLDSGIITDIPETTGITGGPQRHAPR